MLASRGDAPVASAQAAGSTRRSRWSRGGCEEVDEVIEEARAAGARIGREPGETFWGGYSGVFVDPDGHPREVAHNPGWTVNDDGTITL
jgi:uncharacterized glyoxalase superfamily protein PhnB